MSVSILEYNRDICSIKISRRQRLERVYIPVLQGLWASVCQVSLGTFSNVFLVFARMRVRLNAAVLKCTYVNVCVLWVLKGLRVSSLCTVLLYARENKTETERARERERERSWQRDRGDRWFALGKTVLVRRLFHFTSQRRMLYIYTHDNRVSTTNHIINP